MGNLKADRKKLFFINIIKKPTPHWEHSLLAAAIEKKIQKLIPSRFSVVWVFDDMTCLLEAVPPADPFDSRGDQYP